jgi:protease I
MSVLVRASSNQEEGAEVIGAGLELKPIHGKNGLEVTPSVKIETLRADDLFALRPAWRLGA